MIAVMPQYAAVDLGSNSVRLLVADVVPGDPQPKITRLAEDRQVTRLGASVFHDGRVSPQAMTEVCQVLERMRTTWQRFDVIGIRAVATSATRDASNQAEFIERASAAIGAPIEIISGQEEARLIHLGVECVWPHPEERVLMIDVGGGSAELIVAEFGRLTAAWSRPLGAVRLQESFLHSDPPTKVELHRLREFIEEKLAIAMPRLKGRQFNRVIATSASASALLSAVHRITRAKRDQADRLRATTSQVRRLFKDLTQKTLEQRRKVTGIGPRRAEIIVPGVAVFLTVLESLNLPAIHYCAAGLRDGLVADLVQRRVGREMARMSREQRQVVETLGRRFGADLRHARKLAEFGHELFTSLEPLHRLPPYYGKLLEAACYLYDIGHFISDISHHKHSQYIIAHADLAGFTDSERQLIGQLCRYHRKAMPNQRHSDFQSLGLDNRRALLLLIPLLRLVDGLDRSREQRVDSVTCDLSGPDVVLRLRSNMDTDLEQWAVERVVEPFRQVYQRGLAVTVSKENR